MFFTIVGYISDVETMATGKAIRESRRLRKVYGGRRWRKMKGIATIELADGVEPRFTGTKPTESDQESSGSTHTGRNEERDSEVPRVDCWY